MVVHATAGAMGGGAVPIRASNARFRLGESLEKNVDTERCGVTPDIMDKGLGRFCVCPWNGTSCWSQLRV